MLIAVLILSIFNLILLIGIAGSVAKLLRYYAVNESDEGTQWNEIIRQRRRLDAQNRPLNYADPLLAKSPEPDHSNWNGIPKLSE
jgi:hypothetical protein